MSTENIAGHIYERVTLKSGVKIIAIKNNKFLFIKEYRTHEKTSRLKLVSGWSDKPSKTTLEIAQEELREEACYKAKKWSLFHTSQNIGQTVEFPISYFVAEDLTLLAPQKNPDSDIVEEVVFLGHKELKEKLLDKKILWDEDVAVLLIYLVKNYPKNNFNI